MKLVSTLFAALFILAPTHAFAAFSLDSVHSIECKDLKPTATMNVFFTTTDAASKAYTRQSGSIPYDYANKKSYNNQTGEMVLDNNPDTDGGVISLVDSYNPNSLGRLILTPSAKAHEYLGSLSGDVQTATDDHSFNISNYALTCVVK